MPPSCLRAFAQAVPLPEVHFPREMPASESSRPSRTGNRGPQGRALWLPAGGVWRKERPSQLLAPAPPPAPCLHLRLRVSNWAHRPCPAHPRSTQMMRVWRIMGVEASRGMWPLVSCPAQDPARVPVNGGDAGGRAWLAHWVLAVCPEPQVASLSLSHRGPCDLLPPPFSAAVAFLKRRNSSRAGCLCPGPALGHFWEDRWSLSLLMSLCVPVEGENPLPWVWIRCHSLSGGCEAPYP